MVLGGVSLGDLQWSLLVIFFMVSYFLILFQVIVDVFRRDASGANKALWLLFLLVAPVIALIAYMIVNGEGMARRRMGDVAAAQSQTDDYIRSVAGGGAASEIARGKELLDAGAISADEFAKLKARVLTG